MRPDLQCFTEFLNEFLAFFDMTDGLHVTACMHCDIGKDSDQVEEKMVLGWNKIRNER